VTKDAPPLRKVPCPTCGDPAVLAPFNPFRPFCSERCRLVDLGGWASESYRIPGPPAIDEPEAPADGSGEQEH
jgi:endogenous inhibitor of DNA gyrase (YacG/DUF329 family)